MSGSTSPVYGPPRFRVLGLADIPEADESLKKIFANFARPGLFGRMAHFPKICGPFGKFANVFLNKLELSHHRREVAIVRTASLAASPYEMQQHIPVVKKALNWTD